MGRGALVFKGEKKKPKKKGKKAKRSIYESNRVGVDSVEATNKAAHLPQDGHNSETAPAASPTIGTPQMQVGTGKITTSGTVVTGIGTKFARQLRVGDALIVNEEMRVVTMLVSDTALNLSSAFGSSIKRPSSFNYISKPRNLQVEQAVAAKKVAQTKKEEAEHAFGRYGSGEEVVFRTKTEHGSYRIERTQVDKNKLSRTELLDFRSKKTSDKYC